MEDNKMPMPFDWEKEYLELKDDAWEEERHLTEMTDEQWEDFLATILNKKENEQKNDQFFRTA